jgi:fatty-acyl-CoA synthase
MESWQTNYGISGIEPFVIPINIRLTNDQTEYIINNSEDKVIIDAIL